MAAIAAMTGAGGCAGYWVVTPAGQVIPFGAAVSYGSLGSVHLAADIETMAPSTDGNGYYLLDHVGGVYAFGDAPYLGRA